MQLKSLHLGRGKNSSRPVIYASDIQESDLPYADVFQRWHICSHVHHLTATEGRNDCNFNSVNIPPQCHIFVTA